MARLSLLGGSYEAKSVIANSQKCINLFCEINPEENQAPVPVTHYQTPGLDLLIAGNGAPTRCLFTASNGDFYQVIGENVYFVAPDFSRQLLGKINDGTSIVRMQDNGLAIILVDGSENGYAIDMVTRAFSFMSRINFYGGTNIAILDGFFILNVPGTNEFYCSLATVTYAMLVGGTAFDPLDVAAKNGYPDQIVTIVVIQGYIWLIGELTTEVWYNTGNALFPFERFSGVNIIEHGTAAAYSVVAQDLFPYWITQDKQGQRLIVKGKNYQMTRISNHAIENTIAGFPTVADCQAYIYQQGGHVHVVFNFPTANRTLVFDEATQQWHERCWTDNNGILNRHRANCGSSAYNKVLVGDWQNGNLYAFNQNTYTDNGQPISRIRSFPHIINDGNRQIYTSFTADMAVGSDDGSIDSNTTANPPVVSLRWSDDRGISYGNSIEQSLGATGQYLTSVQFNRLGLARDRVFELSWSAPFDTALQGAWLDAIPART